MHCHKSSWNFMGDFGEKLRNFQIFPLFWHLPEVTQSVITRFVLKNVNFYQIRCSFSWSPLRMYSFNFECLKLWSKFESTCSHKVVETKKIIILRKILNKWNDYDDNDYDYNDDDDKDGKASFLSKRLCASRSVWDQGLTIVTSLHPIIYIFYHAIIFYAAIITSCHHYIPLYTFFIMP